MLHDCIAMDSEKELPLAKDIITAKSDEAPPPQTSDDHDSGDETPLCAYCQNVCYELSPSSDVSPYPHYDNILLLEESANSGCTMCAQFLRSTAVDSRPIPKEEMERFRLARSYDNGGYSSYIGLKRQFVLWLGFRLCQPPETEDDSEHTTMNDIYIIMEIFITPVQSYRKFFSLETASGSILTNHSRSYG
jgi:hypothetical protein